MSPPPLTSARIQYDQSVNQASKQFVTRQIMSLIIPIANRRGQRVTNAVKFIHF